MPSKAHAEDVRAEAPSRALATWREHDDARALHAVDRAALRSVDAARELVLDRFASADPARSPRDLYNACARLGRLLADAGASPSLAVSTLDGAARALADEGVAVDPSRLGAARASLAEGYSASILEAERAAQRRAWEYPSCAVRLPHGTVAIAAGYPADDGEGLADWAARVALAASRDKAKHAVIEGPPAACAELTEALALVGIDVRPPLEEPKSPWSVLPWRRRRRRG